MTAAAITNGTLNGAYEAALRYVGAGFSVVPIKCDGTKQPACSSWKEFQGRMATPDELRRLFAGRVGVAVVSGRVSGGKELIDVDAPELVEQFESSLRELAPGLLERLPTVATPRKNHGGRQYHYRIAGEVSGNTKLAQSELRPQFNPDGSPQVDSRSGAQKLSPETLIETRGEGGYGLVPGSPGACHPSGLEYKHIAGPPIEQTPTITAEEHRILLVAARSFNRYVDEREVKTGTNGTPRKREGVAPGDDFNNRATWQEILDPTGWVQIFENRWRRPGKSIGWSATTGVKSSAGTELFCVFSSNAHPFEGPANGRNCSSYSKFAAYALLNHGGDFQAAAKELAARGFGDRQQSKRERRPRKIVIDADAGGGGEQLPASLPDLRSDDWRTDHSNAKRFAAMFGDRVRYAKESKDWFDYDGKQWRPGAELYVEALAKKVAQAIWNWLKPSLQKLESREAVDILRFAKVSSSARGISNMLALARSEPDIGISIDQFDSQPYLLNCDNCVVDLKTGRALPHDRKLLMSKKTAAPYLQGAEADCPLWETTLDKIFRGNLETIGFLQRLLGCALVGEVIEHILAIFHGHGSNGKSLLIEILIAILGDYAHKAPADLLLVRNGEVHPTEKADLNRRRLVFCTETDAGRSLATALTKELSGGDLVTARKMKQDFFTYKPTHTLFLCSNHKPRVSDTGHGLWRRVRLIEFTVTFWDAARGESGPPELEADKHLKEKLLAEAGGIMAWLVRGCLDWQRLGLNEPADVLNATRQYRAAEDVLAVFLRDTCMVGDEFEITAKELRAKYEDWCKSNGEKPASGRRLSDYLIERGITKRHSGGTVYVGISTF
jgi:putative DNA primase/helicase